MNGIIVYYNKHQLITVFKNSVQVIMFVVDKLFQKMLVSLVLATTGSMSLTKVETLNQFWLTALVDVSVIQFNLRTQLLVYSRRPVK